MEAVQASPPAEARASFPPAEACAAADAPSAAELPDAQPVRWASAGPRAGGSSQVGVEDDSASSAPDDSPGAGPQAGLVRDSVALEPPPLAAQPQPEDCPAGSLAD